MIFEYLIIEDFPKVAQLVWKTSEDYLPFYAFCSSFYLAKHLISTVKLNFSLKLQFTFISDSVFMYFVPSELPHSKSVATVWLSLYKHFAVIYPRLMKCVAVVNFLTHTGNLTEPCQLTSVFPFSFVFCSLLVSRCPVIFPFSLM